jgi:hypothetical protein
MRKGKAGHRLSVTLTFFAAKAALSVTNITTNTTSDSEIGLKPLDLAQRFSSRRVSDPEAAASPRTSAVAQFPTQEEVDKKPWKYIGYKGYSEFISSDSDFLLFWGFGAASVRVALSL